MSFQRTWTSSAILDIFQSIQSSFPQRSQGSEPSANVRLNAATIQLLTIRLAAGPEKMMKTFNKRHEVLGTESATCNQSHVCTKIIKTNGTTSSIKEIRQSYRAVWADAQIAWYMDGGSHTMDWLVLHHQDKKRYRTYRTYNKAWLIHSAGPINTNLYALYKYASLPRLIHSREIFITYFDAHRLAQTLTHPNGRARTLRHTVVEISCTAGVTNTPILTRQRSHNSIRWSYIAPRPFNICNNNFILRVPTIFFFFFSRSQVERMEFELKMYFLFFFPLSLARSLVRFFSERTYVPII